MIHNLKIKGNYIKAIIYGNKTFEVRKDDRNFNIGDILILNEINTKGLYTGFNIKVKVTYILGRKEEEKQFVKKGYVILGIKK
ncbi:DUF3850 domain-containing protein [Vallitalea sediminicola]